MNLYSFGVKGVIERGTCDLAGALDELKGCHSRGLLYYAHAEEAIEKTSFGLCKTEKDFIEVSCDDPDSVSIHSDRLHYSSLFSRMVALKAHLSICGSMDMAEAVIGDYYELDRKAFELKYSKFACR